MADNNQLLTISNAGIVNVNPGVPINKALISSDITPLFMTKPAFYVINSTNITTQIRIGNYYTYDIPANSLMNLYELVKDTNNIIEYKMHSYMSGMFMFGRMDGENIAKDIILNSSQIDTFVDLGSYTFNYNSFIIGLLA